MSRSARLVAMALAGALATLTAASSPARAEDSGWFSGDTEVAAHPPPEPASPGTTSPTVAPPLEESPLLADGENADALDRNPEALSRFRPYLDPYGSWLDDPTYGRVWVPAPGFVGPGFQPYVTNGRWALDQGGEWVWVSDYPFGWVVFHYGRWVWIPTSGWAWIPGLRYAPAWVVWRVPSGTAAYVGWAPAPPSFVWFGGYAVYWGYDPYYTWVFCPSPYLFSYHVHYHVLRDRYWIGHAARHTRPYVPATPRRRGAQPAVTTRSPSLATARIPARAVPKERLRVDPVSHDRLVPAAPRRPLEPSHLYRERPELSPSASESPRRDSNSYVVRPRPSRADDPDPPRALKPVTKPRPSRELRPAKPSLRPRGSELSPAGKRRLKR